MPCALRWPRSTSCNRGGVGLHEVERQRGAPARFAPQSRASHLLAENVHPKIVQERLGHHRISVTMDIYSHLIPHMQADAAAKLDAVFRAAKKPA